MLSRELATALCGAYLPPLHAISHPKSLAKLLAKPLKKQLKKCSAKPLAKPHAGQLAGQLTPDISRGRGAPGGGSPDGLLPLVSRQLQFFSMLYFDFFYQTIFIIKNAILIVIFFVFLPAFLGVFYSPENV